ncbi:helix-turn-helix domain-containing protein [Maledivibacter halophilus]|uniref:Predicted transcriptional regulators n=1 Tax=Maledivibacter halophilus TaxID=36842 RepID=A0A1T5M8N1_9FIRM|nr:MerR family transcriptional regulator [Maledivibacter halophilus]SKC84601.1 Predicted transcriptional regulators [Maledivibacter halophilus]
MLRYWANPISQKRIALAISKLSRKKVAEYLGVTVEAVRNWERNSLIVSDGIGGKGETLYSSDDLGRICAICMLLQVGYSIASIHRSISMYDKGHAELVAFTLNNPEYHNLISVGDHWLYELNKLMKAAQEIPLIIDEMKNI